ncbi:mannose-6-phosphate isomerase, class I [Nonomuraea salmonea]|uniref:mannose-6-phosphate isomerase, class I n=1 Tax=Nonomuraea salmonea TaxID=46181 RepID=UPI003CD09D90
MDGRPPRRALDRRRRPAVRAHRPRPRRHPRRPPTAERFGPELPYLLKVLAIERPLSLQVHPTTEQAEAGYAAENARGIPLDDRTRTYKDASHKPEMVCALTPFHGLCGFRAPAATAALLDRLGLPGLRPWIDALTTGEPGAALRRVFAEMLDDAARPLRADVERALLEAAEDDELAVYAGIARAYPGDPGIAAALLLNHVDLAPRRGPLPRRRSPPHAYLGGIGVEIMANSDNVLRCGLTSKHVDVPELMRVVDFTPTVPHRVEPAEDPRGAYAYRPPAPRVRPHPPRADRRAHPSAARRGAADRAVRGGRGPPRRRADAAPRRVGVRPCRRPFGDAGRQGDGVPRRARRLYNVDHRRRSVRTLSLRVVRVPSGAV